MRVVILSRANDGGEGEDKEEARDKEMKKKQTNERTTEARLEKKVHKKNRWWKDDRWCRWIG